MKKIYLSHGLHKTGGYHHEKFLCQTIGGFEELRFNENFQGPIGWFRLFMKTMFVPKADIYFTVIRLFWPLYLRFLFSNTRIVVIMHNDDPKDGKPALYHFLKRMMLRKIRQNPKRLSLVVVSAYWEKHVSEKYGSLQSVFVFPNYFDNKLYRFYREKQERKTGLIHLGQWSSKIDTGLYSEILSQLRALGYECYFSSHLAIKNDTFPIIHFHNHPAFLKQMALARVTIILNRIQEGWNRVLHESFLVGTQVISNGIGGLKESTELGNGYICTTVEEIVNLVKADQYRPISDDKLEMLDVKNANAGAAAIIKWLGI